MTREEAIKTIKTWDFLDNDKKKAIEVLIPELKENENKESEDERIRTGLINGFNECLKNSQYPKNAQKYWHNIKIEDILAWLEKQGKKSQGKSALNAIDEIFEKISEQKSDNKIEPRFKVKYAGSEYNVLEVKDIAGVIFYGIEDEPNHIDYIKAENCKIISGYAIKENGFSYPTKPVVFSEQKPKFYKGAWIINKSHDICLITDIDLENGYYICESNRFGNTDGDINLTDKEFHLWNISDAKNGDVLFQDLMGGKTFIYNGVNHDMAILYSFIISNNGEDGLPYQIGKPNTGIGNIKENKNIIHPATKEQRDLLFQKMKDAGYEWDAKKKEVKKMIAPIFNIGDTIIKKHNSDINKFGQFTITDISNGKYWYDEHIICGITEQDGWELVEQKSADWSEEDEIRLDRICKTLWKNRKGDTDEIFQQEQDVEWLKNLKQRIVKIKL